MNPYVCPVVCPVCGGNGLVTQGFYNQTSGQWSTSTTAPETCRTCGGTGIVGATPTHLQPFKSKDVETGYNIEFEVLTIEAIERAIKAESENECLKRALSDVEDWCVEFHVTGPHDPDKALKIVMTIYDIAHEQLGEIIEKPFKLQTELEQIKRDLQMVATDEATEGYPCICSICAVNRNCPDSNRFPDDGTECLCKFEWRGLNEALND